MIRFILLCLLFISCKKDLIEPELITDKGYIYFNKDLLEVRKVDFNKSLNSYFVSLKDGTVVMLSFKSIIDDNKYIVKAPTDLQTDLDCSFTIFQNSKVVSFSKGKIKRDEDYYIENSIKLYSDTVLFNKVILNNKIEMRGKFVLQL